MDLSKTLTRAWQIVWRNKILWFLGLLASCAGGGNFNTGSFNVPSSNTTTSSPQGDFNFDAEAIRRFFETYGQAIVGGLIALVCISMVIGLITWIVGILGRGALVAGVQQVEDNGQTTFRNAWAAARTQFGRLFGMNFILQLPMMIFGIVTLAGVIGIGAMLASQNSDFLNQLNDLDWQKIFVSVSPFFAVFICLSCLLGVYQIFMLITRLFAERAIMLEGASTVGSLSRGWQVFRANLSQAFVLGLILWFISVIVGIAIGVIAIALLAPVFLGVFGAAASQTDLNTALPALFGIGTCSTVLIAIIAALIGSVSNAFGSAAWTLAYRSFIAPKLPPQNTLPPATSFT